MPIQPLEIYNVEETGELVLKHSDLKEALVSNNAIMIANHNDKVLILWIGKETNTRLKFAAARSSRRFLTERGLSYRVKTCDEGEEPEWFQDLFTLKVARQSRDEPPTLEILAILNEIKAVEVPEGYQREACVISRDFYVPVELKSSIMGKDTFSIKFEKGAYLPEGIFILPSEAYRPRLFVRNGKVLGIDFLMSTDITRKDAQIEALQQESKEQKAQITTLEQEVSEKLKQIDTLQHEIVDKNNQITSFKEEITEKGKQINSLQKEVSEKGNKIIALETETSEKSKQIESIQQNISEKNKQIGSLQQDISEKSKQIGSLQQTISEKSKQIGSLQQTITKKDQEIESLKQEEIKKEQQIREKRSQLEEKEKALKDKETIINEKNREIKKQQDEFQKKEMELRDKIKELEEIIEPEVDE
jgi:DNA repair exonuclease SbcCD ATPase subunit